jgi:hypothetical protein
MADLTLADIATMRRHLPTRKQLEDPRAWAHLPLEILIDTDELVALLDLAEEALRARSCEWGPSTEPRPDVNLTQCFDAQVWAREFKRLFPQSDEGLMLSWFANALMAGWDEHARREEQNDE